MSTQTETIESETVRLMEAAGVKISTTRIPCRTDGVDWAQPDAGHWRVTIERDGCEPLTLEYSMGAGYRVWKRTQWGWDRYPWLKTRPKRGARVPMGRGADWDKYVRDCSDFPDPSPAGILSCIVADSWACELSFSEWCDDMGGTTDSIQGRRTYLQCVEHGRALQRLFCGYWDQLTETLSEY